MKEKMFKLLSLLMVASLLLAACGAPAPTAAPEPTAAPATEAPAPTVAPTEAPTEAPTAVPAPTEPVTVSIMIGFGTGGDPGQVEQQDAMEKKFNDSHKDIQIDFVYVNHDEAHAKFAAMIASDQAPDIVPAGIAGMNDFIDEWMDLAPYIKKDNYDTSDYLGAAIDLVATPGKGTLAFPLGVYPTVIYYNVDMFDAAGIDYPPHKFGDTSWTFDKVTEIAKKLTTDKSGNNADSPDFKWEDTTQWGWAGFGGQYQMVVEHWGADPLGLSDDYKTAEYTNPLWVEASQWYHDTIWTWHIRPTEDQNSPFGWDTFSANKSAMLENFSWQKWAWGDWQKNFKWDVAVVPAGPHGNVVSPTNANIWAIPKKAKHPDQAWEVIKWLSEPENMDAMCKIYGCIPVRKSVASNWVTARSAEYPGVDFQVFIDSIEYLDANPNLESWMPSWGEVYDATNQFDVGQQTGEVKNVEESLNQLNTKVQAILDTYWANHK